MRDLGLLANLGLPFSAKPAAVQVLLRAVAAPGEVRRVAGGVVHVEGVDAVAAPNRLSGESGGGGAAQDAAQGGGKVSKGGEDALKIFTKGNLTLYLKGTLGSLLFSVISCHCQ